MIVLMGALAIDLLFGEPREFLHPVRWMGSFIKSIRSFGKNRLYGSLLAIAVITLSTFLTAIVLWLAFQLSNLFGFILSAFLLKSTFSISMLTDTAWNLSDLIQRDQSNVRFKLRALVGRDTKNLNKGELRSAILESLSENFLDGILSPLFYFIVGLPWGIVGGVASAMAYKSVNTLDSMVGYKSSKLQDIGYLSAKLDDILNYLPARLSFFIISVASVSINAFRIGSRDRGLSSSPNAGWPMAAMTGVLEVNLTKPGYYSLGSEYSLPKKEDVKRGINLIKVSTVITLLLAGGIVWII